MTLGLPIRGVNGFRSPATPARTGETVEGVAVGGDADVRDFDGVGRRVVLGAGLLDGRVPIPW